MYPGYKANRPEDPEGLPEQFPMLRQVLDLTGMSQAMTRGWEAEDAIGALCASAAERDRIEIVSGDRDLIQLVRDPGVKLLFTLRGVSELLDLDEAGVLEKYGVPASRYLEFAILRGDASDGLPGIRGVGEKTARALVQTYGSLDEILEDARSSEPRPDPSRASRRSERASPRARTMSQRCSGSCRSTRSRLSTVGGGNATTRDSMRSPRSSP